MAKTVKQQLAVALKQVSVTSDVLTTLFMVFRESVVQMNDNMEYWIDKLLLYNRLGEVISDHLKELTDVLGDVDEGKNKDDCKESWRLVLSKQQRSLETLAETVESSRKTTVRLLKQLQ